MNLRGDSHEPHLPRDVELTALTVDQLREFLITLFHAPKSSLEIRVGLISLDPDRSLPFQMANLINMKDIGFKTSTPEMKAFWMSTRTSSGSTTKISAIGFASPSREDCLRKEESPKERARRGGKGSASRRFFRPYRKGSDKGKNAGKDDGSAPR